MPFPLICCPGLRVCELRVFTFCNLLDLARLDRVPWVAPAEAANPVLSGSQPLQVPTMANVRSLGGGADLSQGSSSATGWFDGSVNVGASSSRSMESAPRVSFVLPQSAVEEDLDGVLGACDAAPPAEGLHRVCCLLFHLCPEAMPESAPATLKSCQFEGMFSDVAKTPKEEFSPILFQGVSELLTNS